MSPTSFSTFFFNVSRTHGSPFSEHAAACGLVHWTDTCKPHANPPAGDLLFLQRTTDKPQTIIVALHRLYFHPLSKFPGPFVDKVTHWRRAYVAWTGTAHIYMARQHIKYGPVVRIGPNQLSFNTSRALSDIYASRDCLPKDPGYVVLRSKAGIANTHNELDKKRHGFRRRILRQVFTDTALKAVEESVLEKIRSLCLALPAASSAAVPSSDSTVSASSQTWGLPRNLSDWFTYFTFDVLGRLCFTADFETLTNERDRGLPRLISFKGRENAVRLAHPFLQMTNITSLLLLTHYVNIRKWIHYATSVADHRMAEADKGLEAKDFFSALLNAKDPVTGQGLTPQELRAESSLLIVAGSDTTSTALAATVFYLLHNQAILGDVTSEVRSAFSDVEEIVSGPTLNDCHLLRACIDEALRLSPPISAILPRVVSGSAAVIDGHKIPVSTGVGVSAYAIHHNPDIFPDPWAFQPHRWLTKDQEQLNALSEGFCPFSLGPRSCVAKNMAYMELKLALARIFYLYDMKFASKTVENSGHDRINGSYPEFQLFDWITSAKDGPMVQFRPAAVSGD